MTPALAYAIFLCIMKQMNIAIEDADLEFLKKLAEAHKRSVAFMVREGIKLLKGPQAAPKDAATRPITEMSKENMRKEGFKVPGEDEAYWRSVEKNAMSK